MPSTLIERTLAPFRPCSSLQFTQVALSAALLFTTTRCTEGTLITEGDGGQSQEHDETGEDDAGDGDTGETEAGTF